MSSVHPDIIEFTKSKVQAQDFPLNLVQAGDFPYVLGSYRSKLDSDELRLFSQKQNLIVFWDLLNSQDKNHVETKFKDTERVQRALKGTPVDPFRRFIFLQSPSSRDPLACNRQQLALILTHHQVMASFLNFVFTFKRRAEPHSFTSFRYENYLASNHRQFGLDSIGRSGIRIQHCFNILGIEQEKGSTGKWLQRQIGAYHSFDLLQGRVLWIIMKGDATMRQRFQSATQDSIEKGRRSLATVKDSYAQALEDHLLLLQWCVENWGSYTESFEADLRGFSSITEHAPVKELVEDIPANRMIDRKKALTFEKPSRQQTTASQSVAAAPTPGMLRRLTSTVTNLSTRTTLPAVKRRDTRPYSWGSKAVPTPKMPHMRLEELASIDKLQGLSLLDKKLDEAISVIDQNKRVLAEIRNHYTSLINSPAFQAHMKDKTALESCQQSTLDFAQKITRLEGDLENYQGNLRTLLRGLQKTGNLFNCILQYQNMQTAEYFAQSSEEATDIMQVWTEQMHAKTMSMHLITFVTLIFLPGTFVATIFSSGILTFGEDGESGGTKFGDWKVRVAGLKLFLAVCLPLSMLTIFGWAVAYGLLRFRRGSQSLSTWQIEPLMGKKRIETA